MSDEPRSPIRSPYRTVAEAADHLRFVSVNAFRQWVRRQGIVPYKRGRVLLYRIEDLDDALVGQYSAAKALERRFPKLVKRGKV